MTELAKDRLAHQIDRRKTPRADASARYKRLRREAEPPSAIAVAAERWFSWFELVGRAMTASVAHLRKRGKDGYRRERGHEIQQR